MSCLLKKMSIVTIRNSDNMCLARAITVALAKQDNHPKYDKIRKSSNPWQTHFAKKLHFACGFQTSEDVSLNDIHLFEESCGRQIVIYSATRGNKPLYVGKPQDKIIYLYHTELNERVGHYDTINSITGALGVKYFCDKCLVGYNNRLSHKCLSICAVCTCTSKDCTISLSNNQVVSVAVEV